MLETVSLFYSKPEEVVGLLQLCPLVGKTKAFPEFSRKCFLISDWPEWCHMLPKGTSTTKGAGKEAYIGT